MTTSTQPQTDQFSHPRQLNDIPYTNPPTRLQTVDVWFPRPLVESPPESTVWIVYVHGGAWRDPLQTNTGILPTIQHLIKPTSPSSSPSPALSHIAAIASLNYRLSPYPLHPTHPSSPDDESRNVRHPEHVQDVGRGLEYLASQYDVGTAGGYRWLGIGHSCGATLLLQHVSHLLSPSLFPSPSYKIPSSVPSSLILLSGIYSLPHFLSSHTPPKVPQHIADIYRDIVTGAFGASPADWESASPVSLPYPQPAPAPAPYPSSDNSKGLDLIQLAWSPDDGLVEKEQIFLMRDKLMESGWSGDSIQTHTVTMKTEPWDDKTRIVECRKLTGTHDEVWEQGEQIAGLVGDVLGRKFGVRGMDRKGGGEGGMGWW